jgi:hypothetical protein
VGIERTAISGASVLVTCDGLDVGWAMGLDGDITIEVREARTLGSIDAKELKIVRRSVTFNLKTIRIPNQPGVVLGWWPDGDSLAMVKLKPLVFEIKDEDSGATLKRIYGCKPTSLRFNVDEGTLMQENSSWRALRCEDGDR